MRTTTMTLVMGIACGAACGQDGPTLAAATVAVRTEHAASKGISVPVLTVLKRTELEGGLIVEEMKIGTGYEVRAGGAVVAHYHGSVKADPSKVFDSSFARGEPGAFALSGAFPGWESGIQGMKIGGVRRLTVPAAMAKGAKLPGSEIPADSDLVFVIQVEDVLRVEDVKVGAGDLTAGPRCVAITAYTITDANGKVIEKHRDPYIWFPGEYKPIALGIEGMKVGGKRRIHVPAAFNEANPQFDSARPQNVPVVIEVELLDLKNVPLETPSQDGC